MFDKLIELSHMNIVKFHGYWQDRTKNDDRPRVGQTMQRGSICERDCSLGCLYYGIYVQWFIETLSTENEKIEAKSFEKFLASMVYSTIICTEVGLFIFFLALSSYFSSS